MNANTAISRRICPLLTGMLLGLSAGPGLGAEPVAGDDLQLPAVGAAYLRVLTPTLLELTFITTKKPDPATADRFNFVDSRGQLRLPPASEFLVLAGGKPASIKQVGFKRRVVYAPFKQRDLRLNNSIYLLLSSAVADDQTIEVKNQSKKLWPDTTVLSVKTDPSRWSPLIHVNQTGYLPAHPKKAMVGYYAGSLDELDWPGANAPETQFRVVEAGSGKAVLNGVLKVRRDQGFPWPCYQRVLEADFSALQTAGEYRLMVPGLGTSYPFWINEGLAAAFARAYALGIYHQRCGAGNELPFTRFTHQPCHTARAEIPDNSKKFENVNYVLAKETEGCKENPRHTAAPLKSVSDGLYPFVNRQPVDVRGGHHDAGDYSKYTINSAAFIHMLVFAVDVFPGASELDNLGLPESGDGRSDLLQEAKWEADFLAKMQDADGGFYFLVYPRDRRYEDALPDPGDPQVVFPKTTSVTAAAVAALAQCASSPVFKKQFPEAAAQYLEQARKGWRFLEKALTRFGRDGAYQKITHYGDYFQHDDELAWAACELYLATGDIAYQKELIAHFDPADPGTRRWSWWRLFDAYGCAIRSYAFAVKTGKLKREQLDRILLQGCEAEIVAAGEDQLRRSDNSAYGTSLPEEAKRSRSAGWYFSSDAAFDLAVAYQLDYPERNDPRPKLLEALLANLNYEQGCNPVNVTYLTGMGWRRQREIVHQYAQNDRRILPLSGIPVGNIQTGFGWIDRYKEELGSLTFPSDGAEASPYPFYDRWADSFNLTQEFIFVNQARALAYLGWLMGQTPLKKQPWRAGTAIITGLPAKIFAGDRLTVGLSAPAMDLNSARIDWEVAGQEPGLGTSFSFIVPKIASPWLEAEAQLVDGRRVFVSTNLVISPK